MLTSQVMNVRDLRASSLGLKNRRAMREPSVGERQPSGRRGEEVKRLDLLKRLEHAGIPDILRGQMEG